MLTDGLDFIDHMERKDLSAMRFSKGDVGNIKLIFCMDAAVQHTVSGVIASTLGDATVRVVPICSGMDRDI